MAPNFDHLLTNAKGERAGAPFVVLMGWVNSQDKYVAKYSQLLSQHGYCSLRTIQSTAVGFAITEGGRRQWASEILQYLAESRAVGDRPLVFWSFSNGGCWVFEQITLLLEEDRFSALKPRVAGLIFDSCPAYMHFSGGAKAFASGASPLLQPLLRAAFAVLAAVGMLLVGDFRKRFWNRMLAEAIPAPRLYLYSADDDLCDAAEVEKLLARKRAQGLAVTAQRWEQSSHCAHLRRHPQEYTAAVVGFLGGLAAKE